MFYFRLETSILVVFCFHLGDSGGPVFLVDDQNETVCVYGVVNYGPAICGKSPTVSGAARVSYYIKLFEQEGGTTGRIRVDRDDEKANSMNSTKAKSNRHDKENSAHVTTVVHTVNMSEPLEITSYSKLLNDNATSVSFIAVILFVKILLMY